MLQGSPDAIAPALPAAVSETGCARWPRDLRLKNSAGEYVMGRCGSTNLCAYCARLAAVENAEVLAVDAMLGGPPSVWTVLTTRTPTVDPAVFYEARRQLFKAIRRRWSEAEYCAIVEFTTGYGRRSGGKRRPHWNLMLKGIGAEDQEQLEEVVRRVWCSRVDAKPEAQFVGEISEAGGLMRYLALHFQKEEQAPPAGWRGHRMTHSRGYFVVGVKETRERARRQLRFRREVWKIQRESPELASSVVDEMARARMRMQDELTWRVEYVGERGVTDRGSLARLRAWIADAS